MSSPSSAIDRSLIIANRPAILLCLGSTGRRIGLSVLRECIDRLASDADWDRIIPIFIDLEADSGEIREFIRKNRAERLRVLELPLKFSRRQVEEVLRQHSRNGRYLVVGNERPEPAGDGAGAFRLNGHGAVWCNYTDIHNQIEKAIQRVKQTYQCTECDVYVTGFLGGGTGSGSMPGMILLLRDILEKLEFDHFRVTLHCTLPDSSAPPQNKLERRRYSNAMAALVELMGLRLATKDKVSRLPYAFGGPEITISYPVINEMFFVHDANAEPAEVNRIVAADLALRIQTGHGAGREEATKGCDISANDEIDERIGLYPCLAASVPVEIVFPAVELADHFVSDELGQILATTAARCRERLRSVQANPAAFAIDFERELYVPLADLAKRYRTNGAWADFFEHFAEDANEFRQRRLEEVGREFHQLITRPDCTPNEFIQLFTDLFVQVRTRALSYQKLAEENKPQSHEPPLPDIEAIRQEIRQKSRPFANEEHRLIESTYKAALICRNWYLADIAHNLYRRMHEYWQAIYQALNYLVALFDDLAKKYQSTNRRVNIELDQRQRYRMNMFDPTLYDNRITESNLQTVMERYRTNAIDPLTIKGTWLTALVESARNVEETQMRDMVRAQLEEVLGSLDAKRGWRFQAASALRDVQFLEVVDQLAGHHHDAFEAKKQILSGYIRWMARRVDDQVKLIVVPPREPENQVLIATAWLATAWEEQAEQDLLKELSAKMKVRGIELIPTDISVSDNPSIDPHRMVLLYTLHGISVLDMPAVFRQNSRYYSALSYFRDLAGQPESQTHSPFTSEFGRELGEMVMHRIEDGWDRFDHQAVDGRPVTR